jgi:hypothetical protein
VRHRAGDQCEYCGSLQDDEASATITIDHIIPKQHGGNDDLFISPSHAGIVTPIKGRTCRLSIQRRVESYLFTIRVWNAGVTTSRGKAPESWASLPKAGRPPAFWV